MGPSLHSPHHHPRQLPPSAPLQLSVKSLFVRGTVVRYVHVPPNAVDTGLLQDAARKEALEAAKPAASLAARSGGGARAGRP
jgi:hypothetical protein